MGFIDSYKHLDKLCGEIFKNNKGITTYIDEMQAATQGSCYVRGWDEDLKKLKHYRWLRNKIVHDPGYTEQNSCETEDRLWIDAFYSRIMNQTDPLALYLNATRRTTEKATCKPTQSSYTQLQAEDYTIPDTKKAGCGTFAIISLLIAAGVILLLQLL